MKSESNRPGHACRPRTFAVLTAVTGLCISLYLQARISRTEAETARLSAETLRINTEQELALFTEVLESVRALHALSDAVDQAAMDEFIEKGLVHQQSVLGAFGLVQQIDPPLRSAMEQMAETGQGTSYRVVEQGPDGVWIPAEEHPVYYPLTWQSRNEGLSVPTGFNFLSLGEEARRTIRQIELTLRTALVPKPVAFLPSNDPCYWVFSPVVLRQSAPEFLPMPGMVIGFAVAQLHPDKILNRVAARTAPTPGLRLELPTSEVSDEKETIRIVNNRWVYRHPLEAVGVQWIFECSLPAAAAGNRSAAALAVGLTITALMTGLFILLGGRTTRIEAEVLSRTNDLRIANDRLEKTLRERARLEEEMNELASREQHRIGRDLHDSLGQKLAGAVFLSRSLIDHFKGERSEPEARARTLNETLKSAVGQVRNMARGLAPVTLSGEHLGEALSQLSDEMTGLYGVSCEVTECTEPPALDRKTKEQLYLIAREALNNAARHAKAGKITLRLNSDASGWRLSVQDDGVGLPDPQPDCEGMGIRIMRHRAGLIGAAFALRSAPGQGTSVEITSIIANP